MIALRERLLLSLDDLLAVTLEFITGRPQTNGMVERFKGRIADVLTTTCFDSSQNLAETLTRYVKVYDQHIPQRALGHISPIPAMKAWQEKHPESFKKRVYKRTGLDS